MARDVRTFAVLDYVVFATSLLVAASIGLYYAFTGGRQRTTKEFLQANKNMPIMPVVFSMVATFLSTIGILGAPSEMYNFGTLLSWSYFGPIVAVPICAHLYLPIFYKLETVSIYEYFQYGFGHDNTKSIMNYLTGLSMAASILSSGAICTFYTTIGGMKAVLWTDTFQIFVILASVATIMMKGTLQIGGIEDVWRIADKGGRLRWFEFPADPTVRMTTLGAISGGMFTVFSLNAASQAMLQRNMTVKTLPKAKLTMYLYGIGYVVAFNALCLLGLIIYANYHDCDPMLTGLINRPDQILPLFVMDTVGHLRGLPGLFLSALFSAAISTVSSGVNSLAAVGLQDIIRPVYYKRTGLQLSEVVATRCAKGMAVFLGLLTIALAFLASLFSATVIQLVFTIYGIAGGPLFALFTLGMSVPFANEWGAGAGTLVSLIFGMWIGFGRVFNKAPKVTLARTIEGCVNNITTLIQYNVSAHNTATSTTTLGPIASTIIDQSKAISWNEYVYEAKPVDQLYKVSHMWYGLLAFVIVMVVGIVISLFTGGLDQEVDDRLLFAHVRPLQRWIRKRRGPPRKTYIFYNELQENEHVTNKPAANALKTSVKQNTEYKGNGAIEYHDDDGNHMNRTNNITKL
ncbi:PREDICTED: sodium-coupled monocarboxylate transporter 1-like [Priapulus caudatus]|uniref:Sodium-coupled monocarboxylate transporter 1-like n=1 Tax=Priapulus caudatus TaxID=37621 RepID=A0ABM1EUE5_PRICU|nr:PREDICTED: sodium-coupled monocarboxylate transporter 1-like [Priapulus caudatus]